MTRPGFKTAITASLVAAAPVMADSSERFREAMSVCTLPGPGIEARVERLSDLNWRVQAQESSTAELYSNSGAAISLALEADGSLTCQLATDNSAESDGLFDMLAPMGGVAETDTTRTATFATTQDGADGAVWTTNTTVVSGPPEDLDQILDAPLTATLTATFVTRPGR